MRTIEIRYADGVRVARKPVGGTRSAYTGERYGEMFYKGRAQVEDPAKAERLVRDFGYVDITDELAAAAAGESPASFAPKLPAKGRLP
jgi:hypothetical protein